MITALNLPKADLKLRRREGEIYVWCIIRKKDLLCTPEEWVRQHIIHSLINDHGIAPGLIASEYALKYNGRMKRADIVVFNNQRKPDLIVECKAPEIPISEKVMRQIAQYNFELDVDKLYLSNGLDHIYCSIDRSCGRLDFSADWPF